MASETIRTRIKKLVDIVCEEQKAFMVMRDVTNRFKLDTKVEVTEPFNNHFDNGTFIKSYIIPFVPPYYLKEEELIIYLESNKYEK